MYNVQCIFKLVCFIDSVLYFTYQRKNHSINKINDDFKYLALTYFTIILCVLNSLKLKTLTLHSGNRFLLFAFLLI